MRTRTSTVDEPKESYTVEYLEANPHAEYVVPTIALYDLYAGALRSDGSGETIVTITETLDWADPVAFDEPTLVLSPADDGFTRSLENALGNQIVGGPAIEDSSPTPDNTL